MNMFLDKINNKISRSNARIEDLHTRRGERGAELTLEDHIDAGTHELDDLLRRIDDTMRVGLPLGEALEETLVDGVEEVLFLRPVVQVLGGIFNGDIEAIQRFEEFMAIEGAARERLDDLFYLRSDDVTIGEILIIEDGSKKALSQQVLDQHFIDRLATHVGVE